MNRRQFLTSALLIPTLSCGLLSLPANASTTGLEKGLSFFSDGTQIIQNEHVALIKFNDGTISSDMSTISNYLKDPAQISMVLKESNNRAISFNRLIITRENTGFSGYNGTEVTIVYSNTGEPLETYDSRGEIKKIIYGNDGKITQVDSSKYGLRDIDYN